MTARLLQLFGPVDVVLLVKTRLQLHQHRHLLTVVRRLGQRRHNGRVAADAVQRLLDGQHLRVAGCAAHKPHHRIEALVGMVQENVSFADVGENIVLIHQRGHRIGGIPGRFEMVKSPQPIHLHQEGQIQGTANVENVLAADGQLFFQNLQQALIHTRLYFQTDGLAPLALLQLLLNLLQQVHRLLLVDG